MQYYDINITPNGSQEVGVIGRYFKYLSGSTPNQDAQLPGVAGNEAIVIEAVGTGLKIVLMPGQSMRIAETDRKPQSWRVMNSKRLEVIKGQVIIGDGEFRDENVKSVVSLDATAENPVTVTGSIGINSSVGSPVVVTMTGVGEVQEKLIPINGGLNITATAAGTVSQVITNAVNTNGVLIQSFEGYMVNSNGGLGSLTLICKQGGMPANATDGIVLNMDFVAQSASTPFEVNKKLLVPAGYGIAVVNGASNFTSLIACLAYSKL